MSAMKHKWDSDGEHCLNCGDPDWCSGPECSGSRQIIDRRHEDSEICWCFPEVVYVDAASDVKIIVHRRVQ